jgi:hypothetical protein
MYKLHHSLHGHKMEASGQLHAPVALSLGKESVMPIYDPHIRPGCCREEKKFLALPGIKPRPCSR